MPCGSDKYLNLNISPITVYSYIPEQEDNNSLSKLIKKITKNCFKKLMK